ncbi:FAD-dependent oxidoreductase [Glaciibacter psychrotolerans]|uniref:NADPH-dependent 2,4-dienoyl-CoA reductase/sulfur reductase-like enzyme/rhodanese-related sulfurtransferase n=1 Tax=Glaciibacter psychrotolerans TaxID=670054 RepID=A0A7Z0EEB4_9MICO|nr:FAD-dependent oxidoreductase [Leifsonia psychrotolerans]NYJ19933.1 NADPH-dependent 2,4-dienoyl-CoA reductase/sulfur reductase-like enzyme/rhodanese-related sulfurtransferase [Leifsonia psychrotolerans]
MAQRVLIIGGVAGGMSAATRLRRLDERAEIVVFERGGHVSFANCGLPYYLGGVIDERDSLLLQNPTSLGRRFGLDVRVNTEVVSIDAADKTVLVRDLQTGAEVTEHYDNLVLSPGAAPRLPDIEGAERLHTLRDIADVDRIMAALDDESDSPIVRSVAVLGAGFIGVEAAENLLLRGRAVTVIQRGPQVLSSLDVEMAAPVAERMRAAGITLRLGVHATAIDELSVSLSDGSVVAADLVLAATGVTPDTALARAAGLTIGRSGGIWVDEFQRTSDPSIYAVGDAAEKTDQITGEGAVVSLAGLANRHGRLAADAIAGRARPAKPALGTVIVGFDGLTIAQTGWSERALVAQGRAVRVIHTHPSNHAGYYPGAEALSLKLLIDPATDAILGAQAVGGSGVDKRIDVIATAMSAGISASELADLELAYAPQYGSAKDPVNMLGYIAGNQAAGADPTIQWHELEREVAAGALLLDVRGAGQLTEGLIPGAVHIPVEELRAREATLPPGPLIVHCRVGQSAHTAQRLLTQLGRDVRNLDGGYLTWRAATAYSSDASAAKRHTESASERA